MKKNFIYATLSAIALVGAVSLSACSSSEDVEDVNPTFDGETVKTQFTISLPQNLNNNVTRQSYGVVQEGQNVSAFRGMDNITIIPYVHATDRTSRLGGNITLAASSLKKPEATNSENAIPSGNLLAGSSAVLFNDVTIPLGTSGFLFYGKAPYSNTEAPDLFAEGSLVAAGLTGEASGISFTLKPILTANPLASEDATGNKLAAYVTSIAAAKDATDESITWVGCTNTSNSEQSWYSASLGELYTKFTSQKAGASAYVQAAVQDLYTSILNNTDVVSTAIKTAITNETYVSSTEGGVLTFTPAINGYPADINMPDGCASLTWSDATPKVATASTNSTFPLEDAVVESTHTPTVQPMQNIVYPASLYYYVDSDILTSNTNRINDYTTTDTWATIKGKYTNGASVTSTTRSVAITKSIQYAVGRLDVKVTELGSGDHYDRKGEVVTIPENGFQLTGVLIGGQKAVDYKFEQNTAAPEYAIYDKTINTQDGDEDATNNPSAFVTTAKAAGPNYTLALETTAGQQVYVVLEFLNAGTDAKDFQGIDGVVKKGCKFYMVALLNPASSGGNSYGETAANTGNKVFKQDFKTIANFTIGAGTADTNGDGVADTPGGFANAYTTIPDLRTPELELGFSVNLEWQSGIRFDVTF